ncbi:hypothetical protein ACFL50_04545 [Candidatus Latescibacterota bacterium]
MVLYVVRFDIHPDKEKEYTKWIKNFLNLPLVVQGVEEFRGYRTLASTKGYIVATYQFKDLETWAKWRSHKEIVKFLEALNNYVTNMTFELWGPSIIVPEPIKPGSKIPKK